MKKKPAILSALLLLLFSFGCSGGAAVQNETTHREAVIELLEMSNVAENMAVAIDAQLEQMQIQSPELKDYSDVIKGFLEKYISFDALKGDFIAIYQEAFTENEIRDMIAFYKTETGKKTLDKLPEIMQKNRELGGQKVQEHLPELSIMIMKKQAELEKVVD